MGFGRRSHIEVVVHIKLLLVRKLHGEAYFYKASGLTRGFSWEFVMFDLFLLFI